MVCRMAAFLDSDSDSEEFEGFIVSPEEKASYKVWTRKRRASEAIDGSSDNEDDLSDNEDDDDDDDDGSESDEEEEEEDGEDEVLNEEMDEINMGDSTDGEASSHHRDQCAICLMTLKGQMLGTPNNCPHVFCLECIQEWAKNANTCPVGRKPFTEILVHATRKGAVLQRIPIEERQVEDDDEEEDDPTYCEVCGRCDQEDRLLLCDGCDHGYHMECLHPPVEYVPIEEWFCPSCSPPQETGEEGHELGRAWGAPRTRPTRGRPRGSTSRRVSGRTGETSRARTVATARGRGRAGRGVRRSASSTRGQGRGRGGSRSSTGGRAGSVSTGRKKKRKKRSKSRKKTSKTWKRWKRLQGSKKSSAKRRKAEEDEVSPFVYEPRRRGRTVKARLRESLKSAGPSTEPGPSPSLGRLPFPSRVEPSSSFSLFGNNYALHDFEDQEEEDMSENIDDQTEDETSAWSSEAANPDVLGTIFEGLDTLHSSNSNVARDGKIVTADRSRETSSSAGADSEIDKDCGKKTSGLEQEKQDKKKIKVEHCSREPVLSQQSSVNNLPGNMESSGDEGLFRENIFKKLALEKTTGASAASRSDSAEAKLLRNMSKLESGASNCSSDSEMKTEVVHESEQSSSARACVKSSLVNKNSSRSFSKRGRDTTSRSSEHVSSKSKLSGFKIPKRGSSFQSQMETLPGCSSPTNTQQRLIPTASISQFKIPKRTRAPSAAVDAFSDPSSSRTTQTSESYAGSNRLQSSSSSCADRKIALTDLSPNKNDVYRSFIPNSKTPRNDCSSSNRTLIKQEPLPRNNSLCSSTRTVTASSVTSSGGGTGSDGHATTSRAVTCIKQEKLPRSNSSSTTRAVAATLETNSSNVTDSHAKMLRKVSGSHANFLSGVTSIKQENSPGGNSVRTSSTTRDVAAASVTDSSNVTGSQPKKFKSIVSDSHAISSGSVTLIKQENVFQRSSPHSTSRRKAVAVKCETNSSNVTGVHLQKSSNISGRQASASSCVTLVPNVGPPLKEQRLSNLEIIKMLSEKKRNMRELMSHDDKGNLSSISNHPDRRIKREGSLDSDKCRVMPLPVAIVKPSLQAQTSSPSSLLATGHPAGSPVKSIASGIIDFHHSCNTRGFKRVRSESELSDAKIKEEVKVEKQGDVRLTAQTKGDRDQKRKLGIARLQRHAQIVDEVKLALKPYFTHGDITRDDYKAIMKKSVDKIIDSQSSVDRERVGRLVKKYIKKIKGLTVSVSP